MSGAGGSGQGGAGGAPESCAAIGAKDCFSSYDCGETERCETLVDEAVICCMTGPKGKGKAGDPCEGEEDCLSALCLDSSKVGKVCTEKCTSAADCPDKLKTCTFFPFTDTGLKFCTP
jgi:hypothetical protein